MKKISPEQEYSSLDTTGEGVNKILTGSDLPKTLSHCITVL